MTKLNDALAKHELSYDTAHFPTDFLAEVTRKPVNTVRQWNNRIGDEDADFRAAKRRGVSAAYSYRSLATYCAATPLVNAGVDVLQAFRAAKNWTMVSDNPMNPLGKHRDPMGLYKDDLTFLVYRLHPFVIPHSKMTGQNILNLFPSDGGQRIATILVLLDQVRSDLNFAVINRLDPQDM